MPETGVMFAVHPHSVWSLAIILSLNKGTDPLSKMTLLGSRFILNVPFFGGMLKLMGIDSVDASNMKKYMEKKINIGLVTGGYE